MSTLFWLSVIFCVYTYAVYPVLIYLLSRRRAMPQVDTAQITDWPSVSIVIAAHNEAENLQRKLDNLAALDYPGSVETVVVSDGSTDGTVALLAARDDVLLVDCAQARGKPSALNAGMQRATGEIIVFMDARQTIEQGSLQALVKYFSLPEVGAVSGELVMTDGENHEAANIGLYWRYEKFIRACESRYFSTAGATGALYAIRRTDFVPHRPETLLDDFETPVATLRKGKRTLFEPAAVAYDRPSDNVADEFRRKSRTLAGNYQSFMWNLWLFNPRRNRIWWQFLSHKVFRLLVPYAMVLALFSSALADNQLIKGFFFAQLLFYAAAVAAFTSERVAQNKLANFIKVFLQMNYAAVHGLVRYLTGKSSVRWKKT
ncbi:glycosyltransferase family 2 protein [Granulosicoccaceae sp. 1_MG-2023]|nr:glycosyltransferase family 2 protein [Granulosicoccaceae sp. 1_MG-2023]